MTAALPMMAAAQGVPVADGKSIIQHVLEIAQMNEVRSGFMHGKTEHHHLRDQARSDAERGQAARARLGQFIRDS